MKTALVGIGAALAARARLTPDVPHASLCGSRRSENRAAARPETDRYPRARRHSVRDEGGRSPSNVQTRRSASRIGLTVNRRRSRPRKSSSLPARRRTQTVLADVSDVIRVDQDTVVQRADYRCQYRFGSLRFLRFFAPVVRSAPFRFATFVCSVSHCVSGSGVASSAPVKCSGHTFMPACRTAFQSCMANVATTISVPTDSCHVSADAS